MITIYTITAWLTTITASCVGIFVYLMNSKEKVNKRWILMSLSIAFWSLFLGLMFNAKDAKFSLIYSRILMVGAILIPVTFYHFILAFLNQENVRRKKKLLFVSYAISLFLLLLNITSLVIKGTSYKPLTRCFYPIAGSLFIFYILLYLSLTGYSCLLLYQAIKILKGQKKNQSEYILLGSVVGFLGGATTFPLWYQIQIPPFGSHFVWLYSLVITYAIVRHRLMDITITITRTGVFVAVYTLVLGLPFILATLGKAWLIRILKVNWWTGPLVLMAALATVGPFVYIFLQKRAEAILLREQRRYQETLKQAAIGMTRIRSLKKLLNLIVRIFTKTVRICHSAIYLFDAESDQFLLKAGRNLKKKQARAISKKTSLSVWLKNQKEPLVYEEIKRRAQDNLNLLFKELEEQMRSLNASVLVPSFLEDKLLGFLVLGDKRSGAIYTSDDLNIFSVLASQAALAIENALFIQEARQMQEQISQAEKLATIGTMADGLSHQINNRFHALSMIAGDTLDTLKLSNIENCPEEYKKVLKDTEYALERIQVNVIQGKEVVSGLLKYSRKGETGLSIISIDEIIDGALEMVKFKVKLSEINLTRDYPPSTPKIKANLTQMEEVFFNLIDNSYDAINERKDTLKEQDYRGSITISCPPQPTNDYLRFIFADNGIGLKEKDRRKVFTPFFTTKVSSRRGTGLGLFVIQRIVTQMHKGKIRFESNYGKGARFILELPIAK